ncbi:pre-rRNA-processing protein esf1 [Exophiala xenobiotica]|uniref:Pre-rRNA-processing protein esf1 n=1 Tax=Vermiconidia calcicola TaxID=1690605 RepID=A0AAV9QDD1_9PEZI|nr:pre-rRNA-processing protein esf1 [Exophiala xenobiotica]KAK5539542.1 pre-rRNA-processing protein esf1 [Vermiconidia calcicola]KAK5338417.1 pre-rRNA-processing protein esf1 [Exophiala xenobiotica]KAK5432498.1 pre-rRNA-processing protein esf1 [Exophiala xenobiotica]KAK5484976.1 pre-rRNA-processing protein esf1 [Exophiala xenobiotica]
MSKPGFIVQTLITMGSPATKKQKTGSRPPNVSSEPRITDPRFANIQSDPRYRLPGKKDKVKLDKRFSRALEDEDFTRRAKVDRYGRPLASDAERIRLKRKYEFDQEEEEDEEEENDEPDDDNQVQKELRKFDEPEPESKPFDPLRETRDTQSSSSDETSSDEDSEDDSDLDDEFGLGSAEQADIPTGEVTSRLAVVNLDWDNIRAADLMAVFNSFLPADGSLLKVAIYPSEFGRERLDREEIEGPPKAIFTNDARSRSSSPSSAASNADADEEQIKQSILQADDGADFDSAALRKYQLERLRYYYSVLTFSSASVAKHIYEAVDGTEYLHTANFFDLRFVPNETDFTGDTPKEECTQIPDDYKPNSFVTDALQHSKVKLTWDAEDTGRKETIARVFKGGRKEIEENDLKAYLGSDTSGDEDEDVEDEAEGAPAGVSKKEAERQRMRALLGLAPQPQKKSQKDKKDKAPVGDMQVTFTSGLMNSEKQGGKKRPVFENSPEPDETTVEKYIRKERERKQKRKEKMKAGREGHDDDDVDGAAAAVEVQDAGAEQGDKDLGFQDPFFADAAEEPSAQSDRAASTKIRKEERLKKKAERQAEEEAERKQRAELELLMADDDLSGDDKKSSKIRHFDMKEIERAEKQARKKGKKGKNQTSKKGAATAAAAGDIRAEGGDDFNVDTADPRFGRLFSSHEYAIDPTNPRFKGTKGMKALLEEGRQRKHGKPTSNKLDTDEVSVGRTTEKGGMKDKSGKGVEASAQGDVKSLVEKIKRKSQK